jgi:hypothetical protein
MQAPPLVLQELGLWTMQIPAAEQQPVGHETESQTQSPLRHRRPGGQAGLQVAVPPLEPPAVAPPLEPPAVPPLAPPAVAPPLEPPEVPPLEPPAVEPPLEPPDAPPLEPPAVEPPLAPPDVPPLEPPAVAPPLDPPAAPPATDPPLVPPDVAPPASPPDVPPAVDPPAVTPPAVEPPALPPPALLPPPTPEMMSEHRPVWHCWFCAQARQLAPPSPQKSTLGMERHTPLRSQQPAQVSAHFRAGVPQAGSTASTKQPTQLQSVFISVPSPCVYQRSERTRRCPSQSVRVTLLCTNPQ